MKKHLFTAILLLVSAFTAVAQSRTVKGVVKSAEDNSPMPGVGVKVEGANTGTITDLNGAYQIEVPGLGAKLVFSFVGMQTQTAIVGEGDVNVTLKPGVELEEVVVTSFGVAKEKKSLGYAVQELKSGDVSEAKESNIVNSLAGKVAGVQITNSGGSVGGSSRVVIRGETSISGNNQPLFVVDNVPIDNTQFSGTATAKLDLLQGRGGRDFANAAADINPDDVESITVLKGPSAAALYGSRAANGVILIKTKRGSAKGGKPGVGVSVNSNTTFERPLILPSYQNTFGQGSGQQYSYVDGAGKGKNDGVDESWGPRLDGRPIVQYFSKGQPAPWVAHPDNIKNFFETGITTSNNISLNGGDEKSDVRLSYTNLAQKGMIPYTAAGRNTVAINAGTNLTTKFSVRAVVNYVQDNNKNLPGVGYTSQNVIQQFSWSGRQVNYEDLKKYRDENGNLYNWINQYHNNPYFTLKENITSQKRDRVFGNLEGNYKFTDHLSLLARIGDDYYYDRRKSRIAQGDIDNPLGRYYEDNYYVNELNNDVILTFDKRLSDDFTFNIMGGWNSRTRTFENNYQEAPQLAVKDIYTLANSSAPVISTSEIQRSKSYAFLGSAQLGYKGFLYLNLTARNDWSSTLPVKNNSYFYPSANASFVLTEALHSNSEIFTYAKIRAGWSKVGNSTNPYQLVQTYPFGQPFGSKPTLTVSNDYPNPDLKSESTVNQEAGAELRFFKNRVYIDLSVYQMDSYDQILKVDVSPATGYQSKLLNAGRITNKGFETMVTLNVIASTSGFKWDIGINYSRNRGTIVELDKEGKLQTFVMGGQWSLNVEARKGERYGTLFGNDYLRNANGDLIVDDDGFPQVDPQRKVLGHSAPNWVGGLSNTFSFKGISLSFLIDTKQGGSVHSMTNTWGMYSGVLEATMTGRDAEHGGLPTPNGQSDGMIVKGVKADGSPNNTVITAEEYYHGYYNNGFHQSGVFSSSFVKLREVKLSYTLPAAFTDKLKLGRTSISVIGRNLWIIDKDAPNIDPETSFSAGNVQGLEFGQLPSPRSIGFNVNLNF